MAKFAQVSFQKDEMNKKLGAFFKGMLEKGAVDAVLVPMAQPKKGVRLSLITSPEYTDRVDPCAPIAAVSGAKIASSLTARPSGGSDHSEIFATSIIAKSGDATAAGPWLQKWAENGPKTSGE